MAKNGVRRSFAMILAHMSIRQWPRNLSPVGFSAGFRGPLRASEIYPRSGFGPVGGHSGILARSKSLKLHHPRATIRAMSGTRLRLRLTSSETRDLADRALAESRFAEIDAWPM